MYFCLFVCSSSSSSLRLCTLQGEKVSIFVIFIMQSITCPLITICHTYLRILGPPSYMVSNLSLFPKMYSCKLLYVFLLVQNCADIELSCIIGDEVLDSTRGKKIELKIILISSCLVGNMDSNAKKTLLVECDWYIAKKEPKLLQIVHVFIWKALLYVLDRMLPTNAYLWNLFSLSKSQVNSVMFRRI